MALIFDVKVCPGSRRHLWIIDKSGVLKCYVKSQAESGKANAELIKSIAHLLRITQNMIAIVGGSQTRKKKIKIEIDMSYQKLLESLGIQLQMDLFKK